MEDLKECKGCGRLHRPDLMYKDKICGDCWVVIFEILEGEEQDQEIERLGL